MAYDDAILPLTGMIYGAVRDPTLWQPALARAAAAVGTDQSSIVVHDIGTGTMDVVQYQSLHPAEIARMVSAMGPDALPDYLQDLPSGRALSSTTLISDSELEKSPYFNEVIRPSGIFYGLVSHPQRTRHFLSYASFGRSHRAGPYSNDDVAVLNALLPHLALSLELRQRFKDADLRTAGLYRTLDHLSVGVVLVDNNGRLCFINKVADTILRERDGLRLASGGLAAASPPTTASLRESIASVLRTVPAPHGSATATNDGGRLLLKRPSLRPPLVVRVLPVGQLDLSLPGGQWPAVAIFIRVTDRPTEPDIDLLTGAFGLTRREGELLVQLMQGATTKEAATRLGITIETARTYLKRVLDKTGTHRQAELVSLVLHRVGHLNGP